MDELLLPGRFLIDSGVFMRALEPNKTKWAGKPETYLCRDLWECAIKPKASKTVLISALTLLEFRVGPDDPKPPRVTTVEYIAFDDVVADDMARWC
jgi:hypothetical protein